MASSARVRPTEEAEAFLSADLSKASITQLNNYLSDKRQALGRSDNSTWTVAGHVYTAAEIRELVVMLTAEGHSLSKIIKIDGMPSAIVIYRWREFMPVFDEAMLRAEEVAGHLAHDKAEEVAEKATFDSKTTNPAGAKILCELLARKAARQNKRFQDKQQIETRDLSKASVEDMQERLRSMLEGNAPILNMLNKLNSKGPKVIELTEKAAEAHVEHSRPEDGGEVPGGGR